MREQEPETDMSPGDIQADSTGLSAGVPAEEAMVIGGAVATSGSGSHGDGVFGRISGGRGPCRSGNRGDAIPAGASVNIPVEWGSENGQSGRCRTAFGGR